MLLSKYETSGLAIVSSPSWYPPMAPCTNKCVPTSIIPTNRICGHDNTFLCWFVGRPKRLLFDGVSSTLNMHPSIAIVRHFLNQAPCVNGSALGTAHRLNRIL